MAVKIIDKLKMRDKDKSRVQAEIAVLKRVRHRHLVSLYEIIETEKSLLLVTEFLPNGELFRLILKEKRYVLPHAVSPRSRPAATSSRSWRRWSTCTATGSPIAT